MMKNEIHKMILNKKKQKHVVDLEQCLAIYNRNKAEFLRRYITMDETLLHHYTPESNQQSAEWTECDELTPSGYGISILGCAWYYLNLNLFYYLLGAHNLTVSCRATEHPHKFQHNFTIFNRSLTNLLQTKINGQLIKI
jgi:hypothetical protein